MIYGSSLLRITQYNPCLALLPTELLEWKAQLQYLFSMPANKRALQEVSTDSFMLGLTIVCSQQEEMHDSQGSALSFKD